MDILAIIGFIVILYYLIYFIVPWFCDCDLQLAFLEKFGKPIDSLNNKVVWITGASYGIGEHLAYTLAKVGCKLILTARTESKLQIVKTNCLKENPNLTDVDIEVLPMDVCDISLHEKAFNDVLNKFGKLDILVNNAGRSQRANWENIELEVDKQMFDLNVFSHISLSRIVAKYFLQQDSGHIVVVSSLAGVNPVPFSATYTATKHALHGYYKPFLLEKCNSNVNISIVCPGPTQTNFLAEAFTEKSGEKFGENTAVSTNKLGVRRCAKLIAVAIANRTIESWMSNPLALQLTYLVFYNPNLGTWILKKLGTQFLQRIRDTKNVVK